MAVVETTFRAMASHVQVLVVNGPPEAGTIAEQALAQLESAWSRFVDTSDISRLNSARGRPVQLQPATLRLVELMIEAWEITKGRFDPTVLPALLAAGYVASIDDPSAVTTLATPTTGGSAPNTATLREVVVDHIGQSVTLPLGITIDAGGLGKGLAADLVVAELLARGTEGALVSIGGDLAAAGKAPDDDGWTLDIEDHLDPNRTLCRVLFSAGGVATSSTRSRRWTCAGTEQHHTIDPRTGAPSQSDLVGASAIGSCGWQAEVHSTALLLGGAHHFDDYTRDNEIEAIATTSTGARLATAALADLLHDAVAS